MISEIKGILFVEDHPFQQTLLFKLAKAQGLEPNVVATSADALQALTATDLYRIVVMDRNIRGMEDGLDCTRKIRVLDKQRNRKTVIIGLSADSTDEDRQACIAAGMDDFYAKPMNHEKLQAILERWLK